MNPVQIEGFTRTLGKPKDWDDSKGECNSLSILDVPHPIGNVMVSEWHLSKDDLRILNAGGVIKLFVVGTSHPPVHLEAQEGYAVPRAPDNEPCKNDEGAYSR